MSKILFLTSIYKYEDKGNLYTDLVDTLAAHGNSVVVMTPKERKYKAKEAIQQYGNIQCLSFRCLNFRGKVNIIEKGIATLTLGAQYKHSLKKYFRHDRFDVVIYATLPITYAPVVNYVKRRDGAISYLLQKDFFPQSAVDLELMRKDSILYHVFRCIEKELFACSDKIGVISPKNVQYLLEHNPQILPYKADYCPNSIVPSTDEKLRQSRQKKEAVRKKYGIPQDAVVFIYGGVISRAQGVEYIKRVFTEVKKEELNAAYFLLIGSGNGYDDLSRHIESLQADNIVVKPFMPKQSFDEILSASDVGLIFLDHRFTIANIPSRTLAHLDMGQPIVAATDAYTDYRELIEKHEIGLWCQSSRPAEMVDHMKRMINDREFRLRCGENARELLKKEFSTEVTYSVIKKATNIHEKNS